MDRLKRENGVSLSDAKILVVDDADFSRILIEEILRQVGFSSITMACDGNEAYDKTLEIRPDLVLLDLMMPGADGFEYCKKIRSHTEFTRLPVIVQSAVVSHEHIANAFKAGATDYITKPINKDEIIARIMIHLENRLLMRDLSMYKDRVESELEDAQKAQRSIIPSDTEIKEISLQYGLDIAYYFEPSSEIGGDFWGVKGINHKELAIYIVDFSGHGINAAINTFRLHAILEEQADFSDPALLLIRLNNRLCNLLSPGQFATIFYAVINNETGKLRYSAAGAPSPIIVTHEGKINIIDASGVPLGVVRNMEYKNSEAVLKARDILMTYSDALIETQDENGNFFDEGDISNVLIKNINHGSVKILDEIIKKFEKHSGGIINDDLTINIYHRARIV